MTRREEICKEARGDMQSFPQPEARGDMHGPRHSEHQAREDMHDRVTHRAREDMHGRPRTKREKICMDGPLRQARRGRGLALAGATWAQGFGRSLLRPQALSRLGTWVLLGMSFKPSGSTST